MKLEFLSKDNVDEVILLEKNNFDDGYNKNVLISSFDSGRFYVLGLRENEKLVGIISFSLSIDCADIDGITIDNNFRKRGYAKLLISEMEKFIKDKNISSIMLEVRKSNIPAINLYACCGFKQISIRKKYYSNGEDALIFNKGI